jgi:hypothetical protein
MENIINAQLDKNVGQIIYVGAGNVPNIGWLRSLSYEQLQLIEPVESIAKKLTKKYARDNVIVKNLAISNVTGVSDFTFMHPAKYSSLKQKINLSTVFKNSRVQEVKTVNTLSLSELIQNENLDKNKSNILILSINGSELDCLKSVSQDELTQFSIIIVQVESKGIYNNTNHGVVNENTLDNITNVKAELKEKGFYIEDIQADGAIFTNLIVRRDDVVLSRIKALIIERKELNSVNHKLREADVEHRAKIDGLQKHIEEQEYQTACITKLESKLLASNEAKVNEENKAAQQVKIYTESIAELESKLLASKEAKVNEENKTTQQVKIYTESLAELESKLLASNEAKVNGEIEAEERVQVQLKHIAEFESQKSDFIEKVMALEIEHQKLQVINNDNQKILDTTKVALQSRILELESKITNTESELKKESIRLQENENKIDSQAKQINSLKSEHLASTLSSNLGQKMLAKAQIDLESLRESYAGKVLAEKELFELVKELRQKLTFASKYYFKLQQEHPELLASDNRVENS